MDYYFHCQDFNNRNWIVKSKYESISISEAEQTLRQGRGEIKIATIMRVDNIVDATFY